MAVDESVYLELKGIIIDWAEGRAITYSSLGAVVPRAEVVIMLKRVIKEMSGRMSGRLWKK